MKRVLVIAAVALAGCGSEQRKQPDQVTNEPGLRVFSAQGCGSCHKLSSAGSTATLGPNLDNVLRNRERDSIKQAIVNPPDGTVMPADYGQRMTEQELEQLVDFLINSVG